MKAVALATLLSAGCSTPVATRLSDSDAQAAMTSLERAGVAADLVSTPEGATLRVGVADAERALDALAVRPRGSASPTTRELLGAPSLVPSRRAERARLAAGLSGDVERSLAALPGIVTARVHIALPEDSPLTADRRGPAAKASVLVLQRPGAAPTPEEDVRRLVAGATSELSPEAVDIITRTMSNAQADLPSPDLVRFGPLTTTPEGRRIAKGLLAGFIGLQLALLGLVLALWRRARPGPASGSS